MGIRQFKSADFYVTTTDPKILSPEFQLKTTFTDAGKALIKEYYAHKYSTQLTFLSEELSAADQLKELSAQLPHFRLIQTAPYRHAFIVQQVKHAIVIVYLRESGEEGILYADSLGETKGYVLELQKLTGLTIYSVKDARQSSGYGCFADAFVFARDITGKDPSLGGYRISNLLAQLKERADKQGDGHYHVKLPNILLKTAQLPAFVKHHQHIDQLNAPIHKMLPLAAFRDRYTDKNAVITSATPGQTLTKDMASYLRRKGNKYAKIIQIQYYLNEIGNAVRLSEELRRLFVKGAKAILEEHKDVMPTGNAPDLFELANLFADVQQHREQNDDKLHADLSRAADLGWFPILYELAKDALDLDELFWYSIANTGLLDALLSHQVIDPNKVSGDRDNALTIAVGQKAVEAVEVLLKHGADPALNIYDGNTPLHIALNVKGQKPQVVKALLDRCANPNVANSDGDTPLHLAVRHNGGVIDLLLNKPNIDPSIKNRRNETPLDLADQKKLSVYKEAAAKMRAIISAREGSHM
jgi:Ankyrin repeats (3 copies)